MSPELHVSRKKTSHEITDHLADNPISLRRCPTAARAFVSPRRRHLFTRVVFRPHVGKRALPGQRFAGCAVEGSTHTDCRCNSQNEASYGPSMRLNRQPIRKIGSDHGRNLKKRRRALTFVCMVLQMVARLHGLRALNHARSKATGGRHREIFRQANHGAWTMSWEGFLRKALDEVTDTGGKCSSRAE